MKSNQQRRSRYLTSCFRYALSFFIFFIFIFFLETIFIVFPMGYVMATLSTSTKYELQPHLLMPVLVNFRHSVISTTPPATPLFNLTPFRRYLCTIFDTLMIILIFQSTFAASFSQFEAFSNFDHTPGHTPFYCDTI